MMTGERGPEVTYNGGKSGSGPIVVLIVIGTRSEAVKTAPVIKAMRSSGSFLPVVLVTGQHEELVDDPLDAFGIQPDYRLNTLRPDRSMSDLQSAIMKGVDMVMSAEHPGWVLVQGDTISALSGAMCAFYAGVPLIHVESGLRTGHIDDPFPEEANRRIIDMVSTLHAAPTRRASGNLLREGIPLSGIVTCGSTCIDALRMTDWEGVPMPHMHEGFDPSKRTVLLTLHRRETQGRTMMRMLEAVGDVMVRHGGDTQLVFPVHPSPAIHDIAHGSLGCVPNVFITGPMGYKDFHALMSRAWLVVTDSRGIVEESAYFHIPTLILRNHVEDADIMNMGPARLVGTDPSDISKALGTILDDDGVQDSMVRTGNPFGDGHATGMILDALKEMTEEHHPTSDGREGIS